LGRWIFLRFVLLLAVMAAPLFALILLTTESGFRGYVYQGDVSKAMAFAPLLEKEWERQQSWEALEPLLAQAPFSYHASAPLPGDNASQEVDWIRERIVILDTSRRVVVDSKHVLLGTTHPAGHVSDAIVLKNSEGWTTGYLLVGTMVDPALTQNHEAFLSTTVLTLAGLFLISLALAVPLAFWLGSRIARPLRALVQGTQRAALGDWSWNLPLGAPSEVRELGAAFQNLGHSLRLSEDRKAQLLADAAHELRTPLTVIRGTVEAMLEGVFPLDKKTLESVFAEAVRLEKIVESLRQLEDLHSQPFHAADFGWHELVQRAAGLFQVEARSRRQTLVVECPVRLRGKGEPEGVQQILVNLLSNALRHGRDGGTVRVEVVPGPAGAVLSVEDDGPGVPPDQRQTIFERFVRLDPSRSGQTGGRGLGLAIVRQLVERHGGKIEVTASRSGGAQFTVTFPGELS
jgi:signal transduction histidine kinase